MADWLPLVLALVVILLVGLMPWGRPHPNHIFILELYESAIGTEPGSTPLTLISSSCNRAVTRPSYKRTGT
jgi:hypothetical protein